ncbi:unnamed protein product, partial [Didymodactylos carnosus]
MKYFKRDANIARVTAAAIPVGSSIDVPTAPAMTFDASLPLLSFYATPPVEVQNTQIIDHVGEETLELNVTKLGTALQEDGPGDDKKEIAWISVGVKSWAKMKGRGKDKKGKLEKHFSSTAHKSSQDRYMIFKTKSMNVDIMLNNDCRRAQQQQEAILELNKHI